MLTLVAYGRLCSHSPCDPELRASPKPLDLSEGAEQLRLVGKTPRNAMQTSRDSHCERPSRAQDGVPLFPHEEDYFAFISSRGRLCSHRRLGSWEERVLYPLISYLHPTARIHEVKGGNNDRYSGGLAILRLVFLSSAYWLIERWFLRGPPGSLDRYRVHCVHSHVFLFASESDMPEQG